MKISEIRKAFKMTEIKTNLVYNITFVNRNTLEILTTKTYAETIIKILGDDFPHRKGFIAHKPADPKATKTQQIAFRETAIRRLRRTLSHENNRQFVNEFFGNYMNFIQTELNQLKPITLDDNGNVSQQNQEDNTSRHKTADSSMIGTNLELEITQSSDTGNMHSALDETSINSMIIDTLEGKESPIISNEQDLACTEPTNQTTIH